MNMTSAAIATVIKVFFICASSRQSLFPAHK
jgi:hypothetical protein